MLDDLPNYAEDLVQENGIPAISIAVWKDGTLSKGAAGILNLETGVEATVDSIFQIGSISKVFTTCLIMRLVEDGRVELDDPVVKHLRGFEIGDDKASQEITVRQLLNHTSGIAGDYFPDDIDLEGPHIARYVDRCSQLPLVHPPGDGFSYSNAAFCIAGRLVEVLTGMTWYDAIEDWVFAPLGLNQSVCRPYKTIRYRTAHGHVATGDVSAPWRLAADSYFSAGQAPAGTMLTMSASDVVQFGRAHMAGFIPQDKERWLTNTSIKKMKAPSVEVPRPLIGFEDGVGLGWFTYEHVQSGRCFVDHGGATQGQIAMLRVFPDLGACFAVLLNAAAGPVLMSVVKDLTQAVGEIDLSGAKFDHIEVTSSELARFTGSFEAYAGMFEVELSDSGLTARFTDYVEEVGPKTYVLKPIGEGCFEMVDESGNSISTARFSHFDEEGHAQRLAGGVRLYLRAEGGNQ